MPRGVLKVMDAVVTRSRISSEIKIEGDTAPLVVIGRRGVPMAASILLEHFQEYGTLAELAPRQRGPPTWIVPGVGSRGGARTMPCVAEVLWLETAAKATDVRHKAGHRING
jgi:hypothetical protein